MSAAIKWYPQLADAFEYLVPIGVAMNVTHPYVETEYLLPTFEQCPFAFSCLAMTSLIGAPRRHCRYDDAGDQRCSLGDEFIRTSDLHGLLWLVHPAVTADHRRGESFFWCSERSSGVGRLRGYYVKTDMM